MKTTMKRISAWVLVLCMILLNAPMQAQAATFTNPTVSATAVTGAPGETVSVEIVMHNNPGIVSMIMRVGYDSSVLTLKSVTDGGILGTSIHSDNYAKNPYQLTWANDLATTNFTANGTLATLTFEIAANAAGGTYPIEVSYTKNNFEIFDCDANELDVDTVPGSVTVSSVPAECVHTNKVLVPAKASTCVAQGNNAYYTCPDCGKVLKADGITETTVDAEKLPLSGHTGGTATCEEKAVCTVCHQPYGELAAHSFRTVAAKASDCVNHGNNLYYVCTVCDQAFKADKVTKTTAEAEKLPLAEHTGGTATCEGKPICDVCHQPYGEAAGHNLEEVPAKSPTCTAVGNYRYYTCDCGAVFKADGITKTTVEAETIPALDHTYTYKVTTKPTTSATGTLTGTCTCGNTTTVTLPKLDTTDYAYVVVTAPTTTATGIGRYTWKNTSYGNFTFDVTLDKLPADVSSAKIVIEGVTARPGETISVPVYISENPGFAYAKFKLNYSDSLTLISAENQDVLTGTFTASKNVGVKPYVLQWSSADDSTGNGCFVILTFKVADDAVDGTYEITLVCDEAYNSALEDVTFSFTNNPLTVITYIYGDVNGDWVINGKDIILLNQYLAEWGVTLG